MNYMQRQLLNKRITELWEKHARKDKHGYQDSMSEAAFEDACQELIEEVHGDCLQA